MVSSFNPDLIELSLGHWIGDRLVQDDPEIELQRPSDAVKYASCPIASAEMVDRAILTAKSALKSSGWGTCRPRERTEALHCWADLIIAEGEKLGQLESVSSARPISQSISIDVAVTAEQIRFFAEMADKEGGDVIPTDGNHLGMSLSEPYGVIGAITPWNVPLSMAGWKMGPALAAGNAIVLKPSELTPFSTLYIAQLAVRAGIPAGLVNVVLGDGHTTGTSLIAHPDIAKVSFTGSTAAGGAIMKTIASTQIKPMTLELGGKSPQIVFSSADLKVAARCVARSILLNAGQTCVAGTRLIVDRQVSDEFLDLLSVAMSSYQAGPTWDATSDYSPVISERQIARVETIVDAAVSQGAEAVIGGKRMDRQGYFYQPTILSRVEKNSPALVEEIFGPVITAQTFSAEEEAFELSDHPTYGLAAGVFTKDLSQAMRAVKRVEAGTVWVNRYGRSRDHILPTGGFKASGIGKDLGKEAYKSNRRQKSVLIEI
ncbi:aldehyde dehydrogenase family protein (plasmid) [Rhizobium sp. CB3171]|uniref:aldehyde dehydrogenase family protein n=1 Tax=Rhizobium sp. CB3171 TaxID=3039157 RepID=UPI0024B07896|nr:aldehyde dehydrogenase family protein [Rhizobium sp. CB3171]WFU06919.1 aldehyde dehydrogenase family protein [Rhizobium sp. CB3171]